MTKKITKKKQATKKKSTLSSKKVIKKKLKTFTELYEPTLVVGKKVKTFTAESTGLNPFKLSDFKGTNLVLFFYPKDATPGCTIEAHEFSELKSKFTKLNTELFGISRDSIASHEKFIAKQKYKVQLLADQDEKLCALFATIKMKNLYGREYRGMVRSTFFIDQKGLLQKEWTNVKAKGHAQQVYDFVKDFQKTNK